MALCPRQEVFLKLLIGKMLLIFVAGEDSFGRAVALKDVHRLVRQGGRAAMARAATAAHLHHRVGPRRIDSAIHL